MFSSNAIYNGFVGRGIQPEIQSLSALHPETSEENDQTRLGFIQKLYENIGSRLVKDDY